MKKDKLIPGLILVLIGVALLLNTFGYFHFHWENFLHLWPIFLVIAGVNLVFAHNSSFWATLLKLGVAVVGIGLLFFGDFNGRFKSWPGIPYNYSFNDDNDDDDDNDSAAMKNPGAGNVNGIRYAHVFNEAYNANVKLARLDLSGGGSSYTLNDTTSSLFNAYSNDDHNFYNFSHHQDDSVYQIDFHMKNHNGLHFDSDKNAVKFRLNPKPVWQVNVNAGATKIDFDLSKFKVSEVHLHGGAASFDVKLGQPLAMTNVDVETGVSGVNISIPQNAACSIETESGLSDNHFEGFTKTNDNNYETAGYGAAKNKMHIHIRGGLSDFKVKRY